ncbi:MAG TPA: nuclear transport factor 2 family protein [Candidatus Limnocylindrales bacterium]|nr:nuclear transport factor 2 family protein [Candidatus Limnocylindrales bacterium]
MADIEPAARQARVRVSFDIDRVAGNARAVNVRLQRGTRVGGAQRRFGSLGGRRDSSSPSHAPLTRRHPDLAVGARTPMDVARQWIELIGLGDVEAALHLYRPDASYHSAGTTVTGRDAIHGRLVGGDLLGAQLINVEFRGVDGMVDIEWGESSARTRTRMKIDDGRIEEQWR